MPRMLASRDLLRCRLYARPGRIQRGGRRAREPYPRHAAAASDAAASLRHGGLRPGRSVPARRRSRCGCGRHRSTRSPGRRTCYARARRSSLSRAIATARVGLASRSSSGARPAPARPRSRRRSPRSSGREFVELSAVTAGVQGRARRSWRRRARAATSTDRRRCSSSTRSTASPRPSRTRCCPGVENGWVVLVAATTENPSFSVISPLLSRSLLLTLEPLTDDDVGDAGRPGRRRPARPRRRGRARADEARDALVRLAVGRRAARAHRARGGAPASPLDRRTVRRRRRRRRATDRITQPTHVVAGRRPRAAALRPATATSTTTSSARSSSRCAAPTSTRRCTTWRA